MATICKLIRTSLTRRPQNAVRLFSRARRGAPEERWGLHAAYALGGTLTLYAFHKWRTVESVEAAAQPKPEAKVIKLTTRERRFIRFASVEYNGQLYMTPQDFLESVVEAEPRLWSPNLNADHSHRAFRFGDQTAAGVDTSKATDVAVTRRRDLICTEARLKRKLLTRKEIEGIKTSTPTLKEGSPRLFRSLRDQGIISYTEYLFLLSILTKPQSGFRIAFNMFDTDGNEKVDKNEFLVMEKIFSHAWKGKRGLQMMEGLQDKLPIEEEYVDDEQGLQRKHVVDTTLIIHFFGPKGNNALNYENFKQFMLDLQKEVLELEFNEFSKGLPTISEVDFAKILLRYTYLDMDDYDNYLDRLLDRIKDTKGITFEEFHVFCQFLNNLDDFSIAMRMYTLADRPISKDEFHRAVKICTGTNLSHHLVHTVFSIFDDDGDGLLSYREFIAIMKDRLHRGFKSYAKVEGWEAFKSCIKQEMKTPT